MIQFRIECYVEFTDINGISSAILARRDFFQPFLPGVGWRIEVEDYADNFGSFYFGTNVENIRFNSAHGIILSTETTRYSESYKNNLLQLLKNEGWSVKEK